MIGIECWHDGERPERDERAPEILSRRDAAIVLRLEDLDARPRSWTSMGGNGHATDTSRRLERFRRYCVDSGSVTTGCDARGAAPRPYWPCSAVWSEERRGSGAGPR